MEHLDPSNTPGARDLIVIGARQKKVETRPSDEWSRFGQAVVLSMSPDGSQTKETFTWETPADARPDEGASVVFKAGSRNAGRLYLCTQTEVLIVDEATMELESRISLPCFNDVHHVTPTSHGTLLVVSTGLDLVVELTEAGDIVNEWSTIDTPTWERFDKGTDYRKVLTTKPHQSHPNHIFEHDGHYWVTRFEQRDLLCLTDPEVRIPIDLERPHDGYLVGDTTWCTTVDGHLMALNLTDRSVDNVFDMIEMSADSRALGWMRGCSIVGSTAYIGFSTLRITKFRENVRWVKKRFGKIDAASIVPTHVAAYDLEAKQPLWRQELHSPALDVIFSVLA